MFRNGAAQGEPFPARGEPAEVTHPQAVLPRQPQGPHVALLQIGKGEGVQAPGQKDGNEQTEQGTQGQCGQAAR